MQETPLGPATTVSTLERAEELLQNHDLDQALATVRKLYGQSLPSSDRARALAVEVVCLERLDKGEEAERLIVGTMKEEGDDLAFVLAAGIAFSELDSFLHAEVFLRNLCELEPDNHAAWYNLAIALGREGRYEEAVRAYDECIAHAPDFDEAYVQKAYCLEMLNDLAGSVATYHEYLERSPKDAEIWKALGIVESDRRRFTEAYAAFQKAAECTDDPEDIYFNWAITAARQNDLEQLERCIEQLQDLDAESWRTLLARADYEEAEGHVWPGWELLCEAFETALDDEEDEEARSYVAASLLRYAYRHEMADHASEAVLQMFDQGLFAEDVLEALQALEGRLSNAAISYQVVLRTERDGRDRFIVYGVAADNADEAGRLAVEFEGRCSHDAWDLYSIHQLTTPDEGRIGVYWRSSESDRAPGA